LGFEGGSLVDLFKEETTAAPTDRLLRDVADDAGRQMTALAKANTPAYTGRTRESFEQIDVSATIDRLEKGYRSGVGSHYWKARLLEYDIAPHDLKPRRKKALRTPQGPRASAKHPGQGGTHAVARAAAEVEATWAALADVHLRAWAASVERNAKKNDGIT